MVDEHSACRLRFDIRINLRREMKQVDSYSDRLIRECHLYLVSKPIYKIQI